MQALSRKRPRPGPTHARSSRAALAPLPAVLGAPRAGARLRGGHWLRAAPPRASGSSGSSGPCGDGRAGTASPGPRAARVRAVRSPLTAGPARCVAAGSAWHRADRPPVEPAAEDERRHDEDRHDDDDDDEDEDDEDEEERSLRTALQELRVDAARCERTAGGPAGLSRHGRSGLLSCILPRLRTAAQNTKPGHTHQRLTSVPVFVLQQNTAQRTDTVLTLRPAMAEEPQLNLC
eukprot:XP_025002311.1 zinc finger protein castor homolog 1-like isoform X1 [Gallus gallus]